MEAGTLRNICSLENIPARSRDSWDRRGSRPVSVMGKADDIVEETDAMGQAARQCCRIVASINAN